VRAKIREPPPDYLSLIAGDAIHNLRAALDHIVYELAKRNLGSGFTPAVEADLMFPIIGNENRQGKPANGAHIFASGKGKWLNGVPKDARKFIENEQPYRRYPTGADYKWSPLWILNNLERIDKHRRLNITTAWLGFPALFIPEGLSPMTKFWRADGPIKNDDKLATFSGADEGVHGNFPRDVAFGEGTPQTWNIAATLKTISQQVYWIIGFLERFL
jgi:hypothetical protein